MERDKFLTEAMGGCWHEMKDCGAQGIRCRHCNQWENNIIFNSNPNFSTWEGFGKLWEWAIEQEWWQSFLNVHDVNPDYRFRGFDVGLINPSIFADAIYLYLTKEGK